MGTATSVMECKKKYDWLPDMNCTAGSIRYGEFASDPSITGVGVSKTDFKNTKSSVTDKPD